MATWPADLPQLLLNRGQKIKLGDPKIRTPMDSGAKKTRRRATVAPPSFSGNFICTTDAQMLSFLNFYEIETKHGSLPFTWKNPITDEVVAVEFIGSPDVDRVPPYWQVSCNFEIVP